MRAHLVTETSLTVQLRGHAFHSLTGYIELNTNELYLISYFQNYRSLNLADIIKVGYGVRANFKHRVRAGKWLKRIHLATVPVK